MRHKRLWNIRIATYEAMDASRLSHIMNTTRLALLWEWAHLAGNIQDQTKGRRHIRLMNKYVAHKTEKKYESGTTQYTPRETVLRGKPQPVYRRQAEHICHQSSSFVTGPWQKTTPPPTPPPKKKLPNPQHMSINPGSVVSMSDRLLTTKVCSGMKRYCRNRGRDARERERGGGGGGAQTLRQ